MIAIDEGTPGVIVITGGEKERLVCESVMGDGATVEGAKGDVLS